MKTTQLVLCSLLVALMGYAPASQAEDIDIYSGTTSNGVPNVVIIIDNAANSNAQMTACTYWDGASPTGSSQGTKSLDNYMCALDSIAHGMATKSDGSAVVNLGITIQAGVYLPLTPVDDNAYTGAFTLLGGFTIPATTALPAPSHPTTNREAISYAIRSLTDIPGNATQGTSFQETWAYYTGGNDVPKYGGTTHIGIQSGTAYAGTNATNGCQKNYAIFISGVTPSAHANTHGSELTALTAALDNAVAAGDITSAQRTALLAQVTSDESPWAIEWARFMKTLDVNKTGAPVAPATTPPEGTGVQSIITYSVAAGDPVYPDAMGGMEKYIHDTAIYGGGKYFPSKNYSDIYQNILKILNEVQAVNSVFSSSSLPVSVNAQGTYLNQIYMGMFRPDQDGYPRWVGNLKQYHFTATRDLATHLITLSLSDSLGASAINPATGFITPNAVSYWTCGGSGRVCSPADVVGGFWVNDSLKADSAGVYYDSPDGEWVDKGGAAQTARLANKANVYSTATLAATDTRKLYTCTGACANTDPAFLLSSYPFANNNASLTPDAFGIISQKAITTLTRSGGTAYVYTTVPHGVTSGQLAQVSGAEQAGYDGSFVMTRVDDNHLTYTPAVSPTTSPSGTITATVPAAGVAITSLTRAAGSTTVTVTAAGNGLKNGDSVSISGVTPTAYNGTWTVICGAVPPALCGDTFTFTGSAEGPVTPSGSGTATVGGTTKNIELATATQGQTATPGLTRSGTTVTVRTTAKHGFSAGNSVTIANAGDSGYNAIARSVLTVPTDYTFTYALPSTTPANPTTLVGATASQVTGSTISISSLALTLGAGDAATVTGTTASNLTDLGGSSTFTISGADQSQYNGTHAVTITSAGASGSTFTYTITTTPATTATGTMTLGSSLTSPELINWVRGEDNAGDEHGPGGSVTIRPSLHGDVLHSRPVAVNYGTHSIAILSTSDSGGTRTATASEADVATISSLAAGERVVTFANEQSCAVTVASTTTFTYSATNCGAIGAQAATVGPTVVVYYGGNDGVFRAVNGNQTAAIGSVPAGGELWGFIPNEFFSKLKRLHDNSPILDLPSTVAGILPTPQKKDYFVDGSTGIYQKLNADGTTHTAWIYLSMRRGGRLLYALDVTTPTTPKFKWKIANAGDFTELGQTWSAPKVATIKGYCGKNADNSLIACTADTERAPVLIFGAGYDTAEDAEPVVAANRTMGRGVYIVDAGTGALVWRATYGASSTCTAVGVSPATCTVLGMNYSIPSDITLMDSDSDGFIDRLYAGDMGGNVWRVDLQRSSVNNTPDYWRVKQVASLGGDGTTKRKFFYPPDVMHSKTYDAILVGSGDREHPFSADAATATAASDGGLNRMYMLRDVTGNDGSGLTTIVNGKLFNATSTAYTGDGAVPADGAPNMGYYINLASKEKVVNAPLTVAGYTYFGTNQPTSALSCSANLGIARGYKLNPLDGTFTYTVYTGGGLPPSPVAGVVSVTVAGESTPSLVSFIIGGGGDPGCVGADCGSAIGGGKPIINVPTTRRRTYWYQQVD